MCTRTSAESNPQACSKYFEILYSLLSGRPVKTNNNPYIWKTFSHFATSRAQIYITVYSQVITHTAKLTGVTGNKRTNV